MKKHLSIILVIAMLAVIFSACNGGKKNSDSKSGSDSSPSNSTGNSSGEVVEENDGLQDVDLGGYEFVIAEGWYYDGGDMPDYTPGSSDYTDAVLARNKQIEERFKCKITYEFYQPTTFFDTALPVLMSGDKFADIMNVTLFQFGKFLNSNNLYDISKLSKVNLEASYWTKSFTESTKIGEGIYGTGAAFANPSARQFVFMFNRRLVEELGLPGPYKMVEEGKWNWDTLKQFVQKGTKDLNGDNQFSADDSWAVSGALFDATKALYQTSGLKIFNTNNSGKYTYDLANAKSINSLNKMKDMFLTQGAFFNANNDYAQCVSQWSEGKIAGWIANLGFVQTTQMRDMKDDYGIVPLPMGEGQSKYLSPVDHNAPIVSVPSVITNPEATGTILTALGFASTKDRLVWEEQLSNMYFRDEKAFAIVKEHVFPNISIDSSNFFSNLSDEFAAGINSAIGNPILVDKETDSATIISGVSQAIQEQIDEITSRLGTTKK